MAAFGGKLGEWICSLNYTTPQLARVRSWTGLALGWFYLLTTAVITLIVVIFTIQVGNLVDEEGVAATTTSVRGVAYGAVPTKTEYGVTLEEGVWDAVDVVQPPEENTAVFITTQVELTDGQQRGICTETADVEEAACSTDLDCPVGKHYNLGHGVAEGTCNVSQRRCKVHAWCPIAGTQTQPSLLNGTKTFRVTFKSNAFFPAAKKSFNNINSSQPQSFYQTCLFDNKTQPLCPTFEVGKMVESANANSGVEEPYEQVAKAGKLSISSLPAVAVSVYPRTTATSILIESN